MKRLKLKEIAESWALYAQQPADLQDMAAKRLSICDACPSKKQLNALGKAIVTTINEHGSIYLCSQCSCPLAAKTINPGSSCPLNKWGAETRQSYF